MSDEHTQRTISPIDQSVVVSRPIPSKSDIDAILERAVAAQALWRLKTIDERIAIGRKFVTEFEAMGEQIGRDLTMQMGRPACQGLVEVTGTVGRAKRMLDLAKEALADVTNPDTDTPTIRRYIRKVPVGVVFCISPWNWPLFCQINVVLPAIIAGNAVVLKPSPQTPLCGEHFLTAFERAGLPKDVLQVVHLASEHIASVVADPRVGFVNFTGSVANGRAVSKVAGETFKGVALELGGKDPAYVREDADVDFAAKNLAVGAMFNAGQSCCSVERIYVHEKIYDEFVKKIAQEAALLKLGDPTDPATTIGPLVSQRSAQFVRKQVADAVASGAKALVPTDKYAMDKEGTNYVQPQVLVDVDHSMRVMMEETFGPVVGIMKVSSDAEAIKLMNDTPFGLTASIWTSPDSLDTFDKLSDQIETGTVYLNGCDFVDANLAWAGVKDSGRGRALSKLGYDSFVRTKSISLKLSQE